MDTVADLAINDLFIRLSEGDGHEGRILKKATATTAHFMKRIEFGGVVWSNSKDDKINIRPNEPVCRVAWCQFKHHAYE